MQNAKKAYIRDGDLKKVLARAELSPEHQAQIVSEVQASQNA